MATTATYETLSTSDHSVELRKAVIAATIGTTIEWYDFFIYGTAAGLIFGKLYFPNEDALTGTLAAFGTYFIGFASRPIGAAIFGHYGDRIGRKGTLIATLLRRTGADDCDSTACRLSHRLRRRHLRGRLRGRESCLGCADARLHRQGHLHGV